MNVTLNTHLLLQSHTIFIHHSSHITLSPSIHPSLHIPQKAINSTTATFRTSSPWIFNSFSHFQILSHTTSSTPLPDPPTPLPYPLPSPLSTPSPLLTRHHLIIVAHPQRHALGAQPGLVPRGLGLDVVRGPAAAVVADALAVPAVLADVAGVVDLAHRVVWVWGVRRWGKKGEKG